MNRFHWKQWSLFFVCLFAFSGVLQARPNYLSLYPCGPDSIKGPLRMLIPQGAYGADFKPACRAHDACYDTPYANRDACDERFRQNMLCACSQSRHPRLCRRKANFIARVTHRFGQSAFDDAQRIAIAKLR